MDDFEKLIVGETLEAVHITNNPRESDRVDLDLAGRDDTIQIFHMPDCCERVGIYRVIGDPDSMIGSPIVSASVEIIGGGGAANFQTPDCIGGGDYTPPEYTESYTWTVYRLATCLAELIIVWLGESNGYYSERPQAVRSHKKISPDDED